MRKTIQWGLSLAVSLLAMVLAFKDVSLAEVWQALSAANYFYVALAAALVYIGLHARAMSWHTILNRAIPYARVFDALNEGYLLNNILPLRLGELGRAYLISRGQNIRTSQALSSVLVERVIDLCMVVGMLGVFLPLVTGIELARQAAIASILVTLTALIGLFVLARSRELVLSGVRWGLSFVPQLSALHWEARAHAFIDGMATLQDGKRFFTAAFWSLNAWILAGVGASFLLFAFDLPLAQNNFLTAGFFVLVIAGLGVAVPSAPASAGVMELAIITALKTFNIEGSAALSYALMFHAVNFGVTNLLGFIALSREGETLTHLAQAAQNLMGRESSLS